MKQSTQIAVLAAVGIGAYLLLKSSSAAATVRTGTTATYPYGIQQIPPTPGTPAYAAYLAAQQQAQLDTAKLGVIGSLGKMVNGWVTGGTSNATAPGIVTSGDGWTGYGFATGTNGQPLYVPPQDGNAGEAAAQQYVLNNPDAFAVNPPIITDYQAQMAIQQGMSEY